jgi:UDP-N-acetylmuramoylalanine--D-glutamate ligase
VLYFSSKTKLEEGLYLEDGSIMYASKKKTECIARTDELHLLGTHNYENVMAATLMAIAYGVPIESIRETICAFQGVEHRIEFVCERDGVAYYNDSKGTNPDAAIKGIQAMIRPTYLIGGGYDKDSSYEEWIASFDGKVKELVLLGATREKIAAAAHRQGFEQTVLVDSLEEAVTYCMQHAVAGDAVLLSPACASWGMFRNYEERGDKFKELVKLR